MGNRPPLSPSACVDDHVLNSNSSWEGDKSLCRTLFHECQCTGKVQIENENPSISSPYIEPTQRQRYPSKSELSTGFEIPSLNDNLSTSSSEPSPEHERPHGESCDAVRASETAVAPSLPKSLPMPRPWPTSTFLQGETRSNSALSCNLTQSCSSEYSQHGQDARLDMVSCRAGSDGREGDSYHRTSSTLSSSGPGIAADGEESRNDNLSMVVLNERE